MQLYRVYNIDWDCDPNVPTREQRDECADALGLPSGAYIYTDSEDNIKPLMRNRHGFDILDMNLMALNADVIFD
jgi:hypothetical protein